MFRNAPAIFRQARLLNEKRAAKIKLRKQQEALRSHLRKLWKGKYFSPKVTEEELPNMWFTPSRVKELYKAYGKERNTNRINMQADQKDLDAYAEFMQEHQYFAVSSSV